MNGIKVHAINCNIAARGESSYSERDRTGQDRREEMEICRMGNQMGDHYWKTWFNYKCAASGRTMTTMMRTRLTFWNPVQHRMGDGQTKPLSCSFTAINWWWCRGCLAGQNINFYRVRPIWTLHQKVCGYGHSIQHDVVSDRRHEHGTRWDDREVVVHRPTPVMLHHLKETKKCRRMF